MFNKIKEVFTKEYRDETKYRELLKQNINCFKFVSPLKEVYLDIAGEFNFDEQLVDENDIFLEEMER